MVNSPTPRSCGCKISPNDYTFTTVFTVHVRYLLKFALFGFHLGTVVWWLAPLRQSKRWSLHVLPVYAWVLSGYPGLLPPSKNMHVRLIGVSKLSLGVSVSVHGRLSRLSSCGPVMDLSMMYPASRPMTDGIGSNWIIGYRKSMDAWFSPNAPLFIVLKYLHFGHCFGQYSRRSGLLR